MQAVLESIGELWWMVIGFLGAKGLMYTVYPLCVILCASGVLRLAVEEEAVIG